MTFRNMSISTLFLFALPLIYFLINSINLDAVGLYYDELHQATGSFAYIGKRVDFFSLLPIRGIPLYNMNYSGALKTAVYGIYLRLINPEFSVISWRLIGISFVSIGIFFFIAISHRGFRTLSLVTVSLLILTDSTILLCSRYDWGPVALAFSLRLALIGIYIRREITSSTSYFYPFIIGLILGISIFEKLSSIVLIFPCIFMLLSNQNRHIRYLFSALLGFILGASLLIATNLLSLFRDHEIFSLGDHGIEPQRSWLIFFSYLQSILELGAGKVAHYFILGNEIHPGFASLELWIMISLLLGMLYFIITNQRNLFTRMTFVLFSSYLLVAISIYFLPRGTWVHHWILVSPFQYIAIGLTLNSFHGTEYKNLFDKIMRIGFISLIIVFLIARLLNTVLMLNSYRKGDYSQIWDRSFTELGKLAASHNSDAIFIAADWGIATQIYCLSNGNSDLVRELFWNYQGVNDLIKIQNEFHDKSIYAVAKISPGPVNPSNTVQIFHDLGASGLWERVKLENEFAALSSLKIQKFILRKQPNITQ